MSLADARVGDTIMVGDPWNAQPAVVGKVGRDWLYTEQNHAYSRATGKARGTNGRARTVIDWQRSMQAQVARAALRERGIDVGYQVDAVAIYEAVRPVFVLTLPPLPALESFEVPK